MVMKTFKNIALKEEIDSSEYGFTVYGEVLNVSLNKAKYNDLMNLTFSGNLMLGKIKSAESIKSEYKDNDHNKIDKIYKKLTSKYSKEVEKLVNDFEKSLNKVVIDFEKETNKF